MRVGAVHRYGVPVVVCTLMAAGCGSSSDPDPPVGIGDRDPITDSGGNDDASADGGRADEQGDRDDSDATTAPVQPGEAGDTAGLRAGHVGVYLAVTTASDRSVFTDTGTGPIVLESSEQAVVMLDLGSMAAGVIDSTSSKSYARSHLRPHTFNGRLVIVDETDGDSFYYQEYDPRTGTPSAVEYKVGGDSIYTFSGSSIFDVRVIDRLGAPNEIVLRHTDLATGDSTDLGDFGLGAGGHLLGWQGSLYHVNSVGSDAVVQLHHIPLGAVDRPESMIAGAVTRDPAEIAGSWESPTVSGGHVHWLDAVDLGGRVRLQVSSYDLVADDGTFRNPMSIELPIANLASLSRWDVDGTVLAVDLRMSDDTHQLLVHDWSTDTTDTYPLDIDPFELAVLAG